MKYLNRISQSLLLSGLMACSGAAQKRPEAPRPPEINNTLTASPAPVDHFRYSVALLANDAVSDKGPTVRDQTDLTSELPLLLNGHAELIEQVVYSVNSPTIIYIPEIHKEKNGAEFRIGVEVQREIMRIFKALTDRFPKLKFAPERWNHGKNTETFCHDTAIHPELTGLCALKDREDRYRQAEQLLPNPAIQTNQLLAAVFQENLHLRNTETPSDLTVIRQIAKARQDFMQIFLSGEPFCQALPDKPATLSQVETLAFNNPENREAADCYCRAYSVERKYNSLLNQRIEKKAVDEILSALDLANSLGNRQEPVVVVAGMMHMGLALEYMERNHINHIVAAPNSLSTRAKNYLRPRSFISSMPDLPGGECGKKPTTL